MSSTKDSKDVKDTSGTAAKPEPGEQINVKVRDAEGNEVQFKIKRSTQLKKLMDAYCNRMGVPQESYRFLFDGHRVNADDTPDSLDMQELDCIDAMVTQLGGDVYDDNLDSCVAEENDLKIIDSLWFVALSE